MHGEWGTEGTTLSASRDGSCHRPCCAHSCPQQEVRLTCSSYASNGKKNTQLRRQTASSRKLPHSRLLLPSRGPWGGDEDQRGSGCLGAHLNMGIAFWADMLLFATAEHMERSNALHGDLPAARPEQRYDVPHDSPRHTWLRQTGNGW